RRGRRAERRPHRRRGLRPRQPRVQLPLDRRRLRPRRAHAQGQRRRPDRRRRLRSLRQRAHPAPRAEPPRALLEGDRAPGPPRGPGGSMTATNQVRPFELLDALAARADKIRILSLDCFDTLLWRRAATPQDVFFDLARRPAFAALGLSARLRAQIETTARG